MTKISVPSRWFNTENASASHSLSPVFYPVVGGIVAFILWCVSVVGLGSIPDFLLATVILITWVWVTGAIHLDGLADCVDVLFASHNHSKDVLDVFKDPHVGSMAVVVTVLFLLFKCALIFSIVEMKPYGILKLFWVFFFTTTVARALTSWYMLTTPYVSQKGLASGIALLKYKGILLLSLIFVFGLALIVLPTHVSVSWFVAVAAWLYFWRKLWLKTIKGYTGDCLGAFIEVCETVSLLVLLLTW